MGVILVSMAKFANITTYLFSRLPRFQGSCVFYKHIPQKILLYFPDFVTYGETELSRISDIRTSYLELYKRFSVSALYVENFFIYVLDKEQISLTRK